MSVILTLGMAAMKNGTTSGTVTITGGYTGASAITNTDLFGEAALIVRTDGTLDKIDTGGLAQLDSSTDWIIPNGAASSLYEVRVTGVTDTGGHGFGWSASPGADGTWFDLSVDRKWADENQGTGGSSSGGHTFTLEIRYNGGATIDTGAFELLSEYII